MRLFNVLAATSLLFSATAFASPHKHHGHGGGGATTATIFISGSAGYSETDGSGIRYIVNNKTIGEESKVYPERYWGIFPLFFFDNTVGVHVSVTNTTLHSEKLLVTAFAYVLNTDGSDGGQLEAPTQTKVTVGHNQTLAVDASFVAHSGPGIDSGLDRFRVIVTRQSDGKVVATKEGVFCPPELEEWVDFLP